MIDFKNGRQIMTAIERAAQTIMKIDGVEHSEAMSRLSYLVSDDEGQVRNVITWMSSQNAETLYKVWKIKHG